MSVERASATLSRADYESLLDAAATYREALVVRLVGEVGLRPAELTRIRPRDVVERRTDPPRYLLSVPTSERDGDRTDRRAYLPTAVERELRRYVRSNAVADDEPIFSVTPRRLQMLVSTVADRAADRRNDRSLAAVSTSDLRQFFARSALVDHDVNPRIVKAAGGWGSFESLEPYLPTPTDEAIVEAFDALESDHVDSTATRDSVSVSIARRHRAVTDAVLEASTPEEIEVGVCEALVGQEREGRESADGNTDERERRSETGSGSGPALYSVAWTDRQTLVDSAEYRAVRGIDPDGVDALAAVFEDESEVEIEERVDGTRERAETVTVREVDADRAVERSSDDPAVRSVAAVDFVCGDAVYGTLFLGTDREGAFDEEERDWLETIGAQVGHAIAAIRRRTLLLSDTLVELEFRCRDAGSFFVDASRTFECRFELDSLVSLTEATHLYYVYLEGASPAEVFELADDDPGIDDCRLVETVANGWRVEFVVRGSSPVLTLTEYGTTVLETVVEKGVSRITVECSADAEFRSIVDGLRSAFPDSELLGKREVERSVQTVSEFRDGLEERLTDRQEAALRAAYFGGYYDWPRESTAEEIADAMGISSPTLHNHLRKGQHELLRTFFDASSVDTEGR